MIEDKQEYEEAATPAEDSPTAQAGDDRPDEEFDEQALAEIIAEDQSIEEEFFSLDSEDDSEDDSEGDEGEAAEKIDVVSSESHSEAAPESLNGASEDHSGAGDDDIIATRDEL